MLEGELNVLIGEQTVTAEPGTFVLVPRGTVHTYSKASTAPAKVLVIISPADFEKFFEEIAGPPDMDKIKAPAPKYNLQIVERGSNITARSAERAAFGRTKPFASALDPDRVQPIRGDGSAPRLRAISSFSTSYGF